jgi:NAD+ kinase
MIRSVGIVCKPSSAVIGAVIPSLIARLRERGVEIFVDTETHSCAGPTVPSMPREQLAAKIDLMIVLGGDGTLLSAARALHGYKVPILAVNLGSLGFLTTVTREEMYSLLDMVLEGKHTISERLMLEAQTVRDGMALSGQIALNDAVINKAALARMIEFDLFVDGATVGQYRADGLIVATPTGSTAYSLAAGGPIVHPQLDAFVITPICPHMLTNRPLVIPDTSQVEIDVASPDEPIFLTLDGQVGFQLEPKDRIRITRSPDKVLLVSSPHSYFEVLRSKLRWAER